MLNAMRLVCKECGSYYSQQAADICVSCAIMSNEGGFK